LAVGVEVVDFALHDGLARGVEGGERFAQIGDNGWSFAAIKFGQ